MLIGAEYDYYYLLLEKELFELFEQSLFVVLNDSTNFQPQYLRFAPHHKNSSDSKLKNILSRWKTNYEQASY